MNPQEFKKGFVTGASVLLVELVIFVISVVAAVLGESSIPLLLVGIEFIKCLIIGFVASKEYAIGFLVGDLFMLVIAGIVIYNVLPTVVVGMIIAFLIVLVFLIIRMVLGGVEQESTTGW